ncbi:hypothetical protein NB636_08075 [Oxalobacter aliiformigenes]|uniref:hypothetical protein n=1 Tax=Oxalobacter aliiformigenes TaxID=2946593 RepID=UPI0022AEB6F8|nr:hypothetical protein [Oxalobacter aliiformigenes]MCZ4065704.1 hypothetical protein [Oxalobacter aliiformigenes]WAV98664.1 hypothetical protein NB636_08075 [Oxalobacter aliiformigenes]
MNRYIHCRYLVALATLMFVFGVAVGYVFTDDNRIEKEREQLVRISQIVKAHYARGCAK